MCLSIFLKVFFSEKYCYHSHMVAKNDDLQKSNVPREATVIMINKSLYELFPLAIIYKWFKTSLKDKSHSLDKYINSSTPTQVIKRHINNRFTYINKIMVISFFFQNAFYQYVTGQGHHG